MNPLSQQLKEKVQKTILGQADSQKDGFLYF